MQIRNKMPISNFSISTNLIVCPGSIVVFCTRVSSLFLLLFFCTSILYCPFTPLSLLSLSQLLLLLFLFIVAGCWYYCRHFHRREPTRTHALKSVQHRTSAKQRKTDHIVKIAYKNKNKGDSRPNMHTHTSTITQAQ